MGSDKNEKLSNPTRGSPVPDPDAILLGAFSADVNLASSPTYVRLYSGYARSDAQRPLFLTQISCSTQVSLHYSITRDQQ